MKFYFSKKTNGIYIDNIHGDNKPDDCIEITDLEYEKIKGKPLTTDENGRPIVFVSTPTSEEIIKNQILILENKITNRRLRDAILTQEGDVWLSDIEYQIAQLRAQL